MNPHEYASASTEGTSLHIAAGTGNINEVQALLTALKEEDAELPILFLNLYNKYNWTALCCAAVNGYIKVVEILLKAGADYDRGCNFVTPLTLAAEKGHGDIVKLLIEAGANIEHERRHALHCAILGGHLHVVETLIEEGANIDVHANYGDTPLTLAARTGHNKILRALIEAGANINKQNRSGRTALSSAVCYGKTDSLMFLIAAGADVNIDTPVMTSIVKNDMNTFRILIQGGADINKRCKYGRTPLSFAAGLSFSDICFLLIEAGVDVNGQDENQDTPLIVATFHGHVDIVNALIIAGADINAVDFDGYTPLHYAFERHYIDIAGLIANYIIKLKSVRLFVSQENLHAMEELSNTLPDSHEYHQNYLAEVKKIKNENKWLYDFIKECDSDELIKLWEKHECIRTKFDDHENLKNEYAQYANILISKADTVRKNIFLHNHEPLMKTLDTYFEAEFTLMTFVGLKNFFKIHRDNFRKELGGNTLSLINFVDFHDVQVMHIPKLVLHTFKQVIENEMYRY